MARLFAVAALTIAVVVACDQMPLTSPTGSTISLSIDQEHPAVEWPGDRSRGGLGIQWHTGA